MKFSEIIGQEEVKQRLLHTITDNRISHAQLFYGKEGTGSLPLALAYAQYIFCTQKTETDSCGICPSCIKMQKLVHPDLHLFFPVTTTEKIKTKPVSSFFIAEWRKSFLKNPYLSLAQWLENLGSENKQGNISVEESAEMIKALNLKPYEAEYRILIIWMAERMNIAAANKLLKVLEEPPEKTVFLLVVEEYDKLLPTIVSRTQLVKITSLKEKEIAEKLKEEYQLNHETAMQVALMADGNYAEALTLIEKEEEISSQFNLFITWFRYAFARKIPEMIRWSESTAGLPRESMKNFLQYTTRMLRECIVIRYHINDLAKTEGETKESLSKLSKFVNEKNIIPLTAELNKAIADLERNANAKILLLDLSFKIAKLLKAN
ncbi:MAG: DNA polymerase III subunit delta' [Vicingaceae bacterium]|nr:MAG: DNA polymerase III subunit delta' [Vicingaceae bacterium]